MGYVSSLEGNPWRRPAISWGWHWGAIPKDSPIIPFISFHSLLQTGLPSLDFLSDFRSPSYGWWYEHRNQHLYEDWWRQGWFSEDVFLGGSNSNIFLEFSPRKLGRWSNLTSIFSNGLVQPPTPPVLFHVENKKFGREKILVLQECLAPWVSEMWKQQIPG